MLILTRKVGERLVIDDETVITVLGARGNQIRIGIEAPKHVSIHREEIYNRIKKEAGKQENVQAESNVLEFSN